MSIVSLHDCLVLGFGGIMDDGQGVLPDPFGPYATTMAGNEIELCLCYAKPLA